MNRKAVVDALNLTGSVASITGVSVLWLNQALPRLNVVRAIPVCAVAGLLTIAVVSATWLGLEWGYKALGSAASTAGRALYWSLAGAMAVFLAQLLYS
jgi:hypothetical protein